MTKQDDYKPYPVQPPLPPGSMVGGPLGGGSPTVTPPSSQPQPAVPDYSTYDIVKATQFGVYERVVELIEGGIDVNHPDSENVSLLHWAAINNRQEIVRYYMSKGAVVDKVGGDLNSTPLHWATRQGHLSMVVLLMSYGADPSLRDGEGCSCIHLAAQFGHTSIVAYLLAKGQDVDMQDRNGMTALMWAAYRVFGPDPTRLLLTFHARINLTDKFHGNTALHWAAVSGNHVAVKLLMDQEVNLEAKNLKEETVLDLALQKGNMWITKKVKEHYAAKGLDNLSGKWVQLKSTKEFRRKVTWGFMFFIVFAIGATFQCSLPWWGKLPLLWFLYMIYNFLNRTVFDADFTNIAPIALYLSTKLWMYVTWFVFYLPFLDMYTIQIPFMLNTVFLMWYFWKSWKTDPGVIRTNIEEKIKVILELAESQTLDFSQFCATCISKRPIRSKHCSVCNRCIAKFDHHCPWVDNCVGVGNHKYFIGYLFFLLGMILWCLYGSLVFWQNTCDTNYSEEGLLNTGVKIITCHPWVFWIALNAMFHLAWVGTLLACQLYQIVILAATTNERLNFGRYKHFHTSKKGTYRSPFHRGYLNNLADVLDIRCCGLLRPSRINWFNMFSADDDKKSDHRTFSVPKRDNYQFV